MKTKKIAVFIAGPTASGKSALAVALAKNIRGAIVNADSMQVYEDLNILSARPTSDEQNQCPHELYGFVGADERWSVAHWLDHAQDCLETLWDRDLVPIVTGGTGLYFRALEFGLSAIPDVPDAIRLEAKDRIESEGTAALHKELEILDPVSAERLTPNDRQRVSRAWEVVKATGKPMSYWQESQQAGLSARDDVQVLKCWQIPDREWLYDRCNRRVLKMLEQGALDEVERLYEMGLPADLPIMKALGVPELMGYIKGAYTMDEAIELLQRNTRRYAKRQGTWFRNQCKDWQFTESVLDIEKIENSFLKLQNNI